MGGWTSPGRDRRDARRLGPVACLTAVALLVTLSLLVVTAGGGARATATVITVDDDGGADYTSLQAAVDAASAGDTIRVAPGTYGGPVVVDTPVSIVGAPGDATAGAATDAPLVEGSPGVVVADGAAGTTVSGLRFDPLGKYGRAVRANASVTVRQTTVVNGTAVTLSGDRVADVTVAGSEATADAESLFTTGRTPFTSVTIRDSVYGASGDAVWLGVPARARSAGVVVRNNEFPDGGIAASGESTRTIADVPLLADVTVRNNDLRSVDFASIGALNTSNVTVAENHVRSIDVSGFHQRDTVIRENVVGGPGYNSLYMSPLGGVEDITVADNRVDDSVGLYLDLLTSEDVESGDDLIVRNNTGSTLTLDPAPGSYDRVAVVGNDIEGKSSSVSFRIQEGGSARELVVADNGVGTGYDGIELAALGERTEVRNNRITGTNYSGLEIDPTGPLETLRVRGNDVRDVNGSGIVLGFGFDGDDVAITDNRVTDVSRSYDRASGIAIEAASDPRSLTVRQNVVDRAGSGLVFRIPGGGFHASVTGNQFSSVGTAINTSVPSYNDPANYNATGIAVHRNNFVDVSTYGVRNNVTGVVNATGNYWDASDGPGNVSGGPLRDPVTGAPANGTGAAVSEGLTDDALASVRFDPFAVEPIDLDEPRVPDSPEEPTTESDSEEPRFTYEGAVSSGVIDPGNATWVNVTVRNVGDDAGEYAGVLSTGFVDLADRPGRLAPGESRRLRFRVAFDDVSINQLFVDGEYVGQVEVRSPTPTELARRHLDVEAAYATRLAVTEGATYEVVAALNNTDDQPHEFNVTFDTLRTATPAESKTRTHVASHSVLLRAGESRVVRHDVTVDESVSEPRVATAFVNGAPAGNLTVLPERDRPHGLTYAYATPYDTPAAYPYEVVLVAHNHNDTAETFTWVLTPPAVGPETPPEVRASRMHIESVTVPPGESRRVRLGVEQAVVSTPEGRRYWRVDGVPAPLVGDRADATDDE